MLEVFEEVGQGQYRKPAINGDTSWGQRQWTSLRLKVENGIPVPVGMSLHSPLIHSIELFIFES